MATIFKLSFLRRWDWMIMLSATALPLRRWISRVRMRVLARGAKAAALPSDAC